jgi:plasmid stabilization system protein ParE
MKVVVTQSAERDLEEASDFYERQEPGAGAYFVEKIVEEIDALADTAGMHRKVWGYHKVVAVRFPYLIFILFATIRCSLGPCWMAAGIPAATSKQ